jgi:AcrR family transcriptional regulator
MSESAPRSPRSRGSYSKGVARRQEILDKAIEVFAQRGAAKTSLRAIAQEVGVTHAALMHYFGSLEELLVAVYEESERRAPADPQPVGVVSPAERMRISAEQNRRIPGLVQLYATLVTAALEDNHPAAHEFATGRFARLRDEIAAQVAQLQATGDLRPDVDAELVAALVIAASDGLQTQWLLDESVDHEAALGMLDRLLAGPNASR